MNCRGTVTDRKAAGTKVQSLSVYTTVDYSRSFTDNIQQLFQEQAELYRHTKLSFLEVEAMQHKLWKYSLMSQLTNFCFSFIPVAFPKGVSFQLHSNGKGALAAYVALMLNTDTNEVYAMYDVQTQMCTTNQMLDFQNTYVNVIEAVLKNPEAPLGELF
jgi:phosphotransferase system  glucose/maltose/N-acetylglucosamine-specific IIC component